MFNSSQYRNYEQFLRDFASWLQSKINDPYCTEAHAFIGNTYFVLYRPMFKSYLTSSHTTATLPRT